MATGQGNITVFYDSACPLCHREIAFYRRRRGAEAVRWTDVSGAGDDPLVPGLTRSRARARFHVQCADGTLISGGAAFARLWLALPGFRLCGRIVQAWPLSWLLARGYDLFLRVRPGIQAALGARRVR